MPNYNAHPALFRQVCKKVLALLRSFSIMLRVLIDQASVAQW